jgi:hypothetical protein
MDEGKLFWIAAVASMCIIAALGFGFLTAPVNAQQYQATEGNGVQYSAGSATGASAAQDAGAGGAGAVQQGADAQYSGSGAQQAASGAAVQEVQLTIKGATYYPSPVRVKKGVPVRLVADMGSVVGCARSIIIPEFKVSKYVRPGDNVIEFTPGKSGTFDFGCSMWMYTGKLVVEEADGSVADFSGRAKLPEATTCGAGGSCGCGCGGSR